MIHADTFSLNVPVAAIRHADRGRRLPVMGANGGAVTLAARQALGRLAGLGAGADWSRHWLHRGSTVWARTNEQTDLWIALLHALGLEPAAMLSHTVATDLLGDQWTFHRPPLGHLLGAYGLDVHELTPWCPMLDHVSVHLAAGRLTITEADAYWLPDTAGAAYRRQHVKTTIAFASIDRDAQRATYFHGTGPHQLEGEDFCGVFGLAGLRAPDALDLYADLVDLNRLVRLPAARLRAWARDSLLEQLSRRPALNPFERFADQLLGAQPAPCEPARFDAWASVTVRQFGSAFGLAAAHLRWQLAQPGGDEDRAAFEPAAAAFDRIAAGAARMLHEGALAASAGRPASLGGLLEGLVSDWRCAMQTLDARLGPRALAVAGPDVAGRTRQDVARLAALPVEPDYPRSPLHGQAMAWISKQCTIDAWIELLHALALEPLAMMPFVLRIDFIDDQWSFYKPPYDEVFSLYGIEVDELAPWRPAADMAAEQLAQGRLVTLEADTYWLPNTADTDWYRREHVKTTIVPVAVDPGNECATYFHNTGLHRMQGEDFRQVFGVGDSRRPGALPIRLELIRLDRLVRRTPQDLRARARRLLAQHLARRPLENPVPRFTQRLAVDSALLAGNGLPYFHSWAFVMVRLLGSAFELGAAHLRWQVAQPGGAPDREAFEAAAAAFDRVQAGAKTIIMKGARAVAGRKPIQADATLADMACAWDEGMQVLVQHVSDRGTGQ